MPSLERRVSDLETKIKTIEDTQKEKAQEDSTKEARFKQCVYSADDDYDAGLRLNEQRTRMVPTRFRPPVSPNSSGRNKISLRSANYFINEPPCWPFVGG